MSGRGTRILIADDNPSVRIALFRAFDKLPGVEVVGAFESGERACEVAAADAPDIVVMDVQMPGIGGEEATRWLAANVPAIRVIAISAAEATVMEPRMRAAGAVDFVSKSDGIAKLVEVVRSVSAKEG